MKVPLRAASKTCHLACPFCERGELVLFGPGLVRCYSCGLPLLGSALETLRDVAGLADALGVHTCERGHPGMRRLSDAVFHCPASGSEILPVGSRAIDVTRGDSRWSTT